MTEGLGPAPVSRALCGNGRRQGAKVEGARSSAARLSRLLVITLAFGATPAIADPAPSNFQGVPEQVIPTYQEVGAPTFTTPSGAASFSGLQSGTGTGGTDSGAGGSGGTPYSGGGTTALQSMMATSYGQIAYTTAQQLGNNPDAVAAFGVLESGFQNVATANGSTSATGPWQITTGTWNDYVGKYNLPYTAADMTNPAAQAVVANYIIKDYSAQVSAAINSSATVAQAYGAFVFGVAGGSGLAGETDPSTPMSKYVSATALANNNMTGWTVAQFYNRVSSKVGSLATQTVAT